ncbi:ATP-dependent zinc metalloprotease FtsH [Catenulispora yoronensis]|uniref:ATP-dependent zinc metalloprotease FtsH n=1 Tax=Catenulispora yoronensis TaxID=450799 RepID=UPI0031E2E8C9
MSDPSVPPRPDPGPPWRAEGTPPPGRGGPPQKPQRGPNVPGGWPRLLLTMLVVFLITDLLLSLFTGGPGSTKVPYTEFTKQVAANNVKDVYSKGDAIQGDLKEKAPKPDGDSGTYSSFDTQRPSWAEDQLWQQLSGNGVTITAKPVVQGQSFLVNLLLSLAPVALLLGLWMLVARRMSSGALGGLGRRGPPKPVAPEEGKRTTFSDVAGIDEVEAQLTEVVDYLKNPAPFQRMGARMPGGVLLAGPPGTGKTLLARAVAGEANVPFFSASASEFIEMIVGVGASRVRELFAEARKVAPSIVFIDEIDTIGRARGRGAAVGGHDEREQTLNQILTEMDGFTGSEGVVVVAATNRADILDPALTRPGRFDRVVQVAPPDKAGRESILKIHTRRIPLAPDADLRQVAALTPGMTGADLANLANEAALLAVARHRTDVGPAEFSAALEKIQLGAERPVLIPEEDRRRTAYHESGHALLGMLQPGADPVRKVTIVPRGRALGVTLSTPENDRYSHTEDYLRGRICGALGGIAAEQVVYGDVTTGAESDLEQVTAIARGMVGRWGMSERIGRLVAIPEDASQAYGLSAAPATLDAVDSEVRRIVAECYEKTVRTLIENRERLDALATALMEHESLDEADAYRAAGVPRQGTADE